MATAARELIEGEPRSFSEAIRQLLVSQPVPQLAQDFAAKLARAWPRAAVGFALGADGNLISPSTEEARSDAGRQKFLLDNSAFLSGNAAATGYSVPAEESQRAAEQRRKAPAMA